MNNVQIQIKIEGVDPKEIERYSEIFYALIKTGGLSGVKGGQTILHFDGEGVFMGIELDYWPFRRKKKIDQVTR